MRNINVFYHKFTISGGIWAQLMDEDGLAHIFQYNIGPTVTFISPTINGWKTIHRFKGRL